MNHSLTLFISHRVHILLLNCDARHSFLFEYAVWSQVSRFSNRSESLHWVIGARGTAASLKRCWRRLWLYLLTVMATGTQREIRRATVKSSMCQSSCLTHSSWHIVPSIIIITLGNDCGTEEALIITRRFHWAASSSRHWSSLSGSNQSCWCFCWNL